MMSNAQQSSAKRSSLGATEYVFEPILRHLPQAHTLLPLLFAF